MSFFEFPHTRTYDSDLGFIIKWIKEIWPHIDSLEEWKTAHEEEYNELVIRVNNILPELLSALPDYVQNEVIYQINHGDFQQLIISTAELITENYLNQLYDIAPIEALQTTTGEYILTTNGEYILINTASDAATAYTTNQISYFYKYVKDAENKVKSGKKPLNLTWRSYLNQPEVLTLAHLSDYHGDGQELEYIYDKWASVMGLADDWICTGDLVAERFSDPFVYYPTTDNLMAKSTMLVIGNHDALADTSGYDWTDLASESQQYNKFFAPTIANWNVLHSGTNTYYYKDYDLNNIRLIVLNDMLESADMIAQLYWLENTALNTNLSVVIAKHYIPRTPVKIDCSFSAIDYTAAGNGEDAIADKVQQFINNGGKFICYLTGHSHYDYISYLSQYPDQLVLTMDATGRQACNDWSDMMRYDDEISRDLFNMVQFDTSSSIVKITRCGANYDRYLRLKDTITINYNTKQIIQ